MVVPHRWEYLCFGLIDGRLCGRVVVCVVRSCLRVVAGPPGKIPQCPPKHYIPTLEIESEADAGATERAAERAARSPQRSSNNATCKGLYRLWVGKKSMTISESQNPAAA